VQNKDFKRIMSEHGRTAATPRLCRGDGLPVSAVLILVAILAGSTGSLVIWYASVRSSKRFGN